jgi:Ca2+-binding RTX toxin-like protein
MKQDDPKFLFILSCILFLLSLQAHLETVQGKIEINSNSETNLPNDTIASETRLSEAILNRLIEGSLGDDRVTGTNGSDIIIGFSGSDTILGGDGIDVIQGNEGSDKLYGDNSDDILQGGIGSDQLYGGDGNDIIAGGEDDDLLVGGGGNDKLYGDLQDDIVIGGPGADYFDCGEGIDVIMDFNLKQGDDRAGNCEEIFSTL